jgi:hypothetical protein
MKDLIFITAYCPTEKQEQLLEKCVDSVINCGFHIALISHSHIPIHIQKKCHYYVYDYNNDISYDYDLLGHNHFIFENKRIQSRFFAKTFYGFAIYRMFSMVSQIAINFGYKNIHHIEYDCELLNSNLIIENNKSLEEYDSVIYTDTGDKDGFLFGSLKSFKVSSLPEKYKNYDRDFIDSEMRKLNQTHLEFLTKKIFIESGNVLFKNEPTNEEFKRGDYLNHRNLHFTLYYNPEDRTLNIFYNALDLEKSEEITVIINKEKIVKIITKPGFWTTRILGLFNEITHVRVDNNNKVIYEVSFDNEFREIFKNKSYILNNEK